MEEDCALLHQEASSNLKSFLLLCRRHVKHMINFYRSASNYTIVWKKGTVLNFRKKTFLLHFCQNLRRKKSVSFSNSLPFWLSSLTKESIIYFRELGYLQAFAILKCIFKIHSDSKTNNSSTAMIFILFCFVCSNIFELDQHWIAKLHQLLKKNDSKVLCKPDCFFCCSYESSLMVSLLNSGLALIYTPSLQHSKKK